MCLAVTLRGSESSSHIITRTACQDTFCYGRLRSTSEPIGALQRSGSPPAGWLALVAYEGSIYSRRRHCGRRAHTSSPRVCSRLRTGLTRRAAVCWPVSGRRGCRPATFTVSLAAERVAHADGDSSRNSGARRALVERWSSAGRARVERESSAGRGRAVCIGRLETWRGGLIALQKLSLKWGVWVGGVRRGSLNAQFSAARFVARAAREPQR